MKFVVLRKKTLIIALLVLAFAVFVPVGATVAFSRQKKLPIYSVGTEEKKVAISFDCAWGTDYTETLLNTWSGKRWSPPSSWWNSGRRNTPIS